MTKKDTNTSAAVSVQKKYKKRSQVGDVWHRFKKNKGALIGGAFILILIILALLGNVLFDYQRDIVDQDLTKRFIRPCWEHPFGTDNLGRDVFARIIYGIRASLPVGFISVMISLAVGMLLGAVAGYYGNPVDNIIMRFLDIFNSMPTILIAIVIIAVMGPSMMSLMIAIGFASCPNFARITRAAVMMVKNQEFVESARCIGCTNLDIIFKHIIPNCLSPIVVQTTLRLGSAIISSSSLSYLGLGVTPPTPEWGAMLSAGRAYVSKYSYLTVFPGLAIVFTVIAFNIMGDGLRDAMDPKLKK